MTISLTDLLPASPFRPPDWRWRLPAYLREHRIRRVPRPWHRDVAVRRVRRFQADLARCRSDASHLRLARRQPALYGAWQIWSSGDTPLACELRSRILAGQSDDEIADLLGVTPAVVAEFESTFFCVRAVLQARSYIIHQVLGPALHTGLAPTDIAVLWPAFAFFGGPLILDALIAGFDGTYRPERFEQLGRFFQNEAVATLWRRVAIAAKTLPTDRRSQPRVLQLLGSLGGADISVASRTSASYRPADPTYCAASRAGDAQVHAEPPVFVSPSPSNEPPVVAETPLEVVLAPPAAPAPRRQTRAPPRKMGARSECFPTAVAV